MKKFFCIAYLCLLSFSVFSLTLKTGEQSDCSPVYDYETAHRCVVTKISKAANYPSDVYEVQLSCDSYTPSYILKKGDSIELIHVQYGYPEKNMFIVKSISENEISLEAGNQYDVLYPTEDFSNCFGLKSGMTMEQITQACGGRKPKKILGSVDKYLILPTAVHPGFEKYIAYIDESIGLYCLELRSPDIASRGGYGNEFREKYDAIESSLSKTYGKYDRVDALSTSTRYKEPTEWLFALTSNEAHLITAFSKKEGSALPTDISEIFLKANKLEIVIEYKFSSYEKLDLKKQAEDAVLGSTRWYYNFAKEHYIKRNDKKRK